MRYSTLINRHQIIQRSIGEDSFPEILGELRGCMHEIPNLVFLGFLGEFWFFRTFWKFQQT